MGDVAASGGLLQLTDHESQTKFDQLVSATDLNLDANLLTRVPSVKNMRSLRALWLASNKITRIAPGMHNVWQKHTFVSG